jgi:AraC-like DNA-binding protein
MRANRSFEPHLVIKEQSLLPGGEWQPQSTDWSCLLLRVGVGYWLNPRSNLELATGSVLICSERAQGLIRASQVGGACISYFRLSPARLTGLITLSEQQFLQNAGAQEQFAVRTFPPSHLIGEKFRQVCEGHNGNGAKNGGSSLLRLQLLDLFFRAFHEELSNSQQELQIPVDAKARLTVMLKQTPASELLDLNFNDLVEEMRCTPRHLSRIFHQVVGMSFREKQAQVRLIRAQELLATTESKVLEVALESGYQSLSLFNFMFKKRFGVTPGEWREQTKRGQNGNRKLPKRLGRRSAVVTA